MVWTALPVAVAAARLVVDDAQPPIGQAVDAVDGTREAHRCAVQRELERLRPAPTERQLEADPVGRVVADHVHERAHIGAQRLDLLAEHGAARRRLQGPVLVDLDVERALRDVAERLVLVRDSVPSRLRQRRLVDGVQQSAALERRQPAVRIELDVVGRPHAQDRAHEVAQRTRAQRFQPAGG